MGLRSRPLTLPAGLSPQPGPQLSALPGNGHLCLFLEGSGVIDCPPRPWRAPLQAWGGAGGGWAPQGAWGCSEAHPANSGAQAWRGHQWIKGRACVCPRSYHPALSWDRGRGWRKVVVICGRNNHFRLVLKAGRLEGFSQLLLTALCRVTPRCQPSAGGGTRALGGVPCPSHSQHGRRDSLWGGWSTGLVS